MAYTSDYKGPLLVQIYFRKKKDISEEEFHEHWASDHANIALDGLIEHGIINYTQYHCPTSTRNLVQGAHDIDASEVYSQSKGLEYDAVVQLTVAKIDDLWAFLNSPTYARLAEDEKSFADTTGTLITAGWTLPVIVDGKVVEGRKPAKADS